jgi:hypothetical protein
MTPGRYVEITTDATVISGPGRLAAVVLTPGSDASSLILYDNTAASGNKIVTLTAVANGASVMFCPAQPASFANGIRADITGTGAVAYVILA